MDSVKYTTALLDANIGSTNVTREDRIRHIVFNTFETITQVLQQHCGPYSAFAITHNVGDAVTEPVFTNDGINIVKALSFMNPIQDFARRNIAYIGSRVESKIGDGTTTAMILASSFMKYMSDASNHELHKLMSQITYAEFVECFMRATNMLKDRMNDCKVFCNQDNPAAIGQVAYAQAFTSSHGDIELSEAICDLFRNLPKEAWPYIYYYREGMETKTRYSVRCEKDQFVSKVTVMNKGMLNDKLGTAYKSHNATVFVYTDLLTAGDHISWEPLEKAIRDAIIDENPLLVICPDNTDGFTRRAINDLLVEDRKHMVAVFCHHMEHPKINDFRVLALLTKQIDLTAKYFVVKGVDASCTGHNLVLNNLYKTNEKTMINPLLYDDEYPLFKQQVEEIKSIIDQAKEEATYRDTINEITHYVSIYNRLYFCKKWMIVVGGLAYDNTAAMDVLMDTINAVHRSLTDGYTGGANTAFCYALLQSETRLRSLTCGPINTTKKRAERIAYHIVLAFLNALNDVYEGITCNVSCRKGGDPISMIKKNLDGKTVLDFNTINGWNITNLPHAIANVNPALGVTAPSIQPAELIPEVMSRIGEVCLKFLKAQNILSINGAYTPPKKKNWFTSLFK